MKDATGGTLLMGLAAAIIIIFIIFVAFFINYGKTFKIKNQIINHLEQSEGLDGNDIRDFIDETSYNKDDYDVCYKKIYKGVNVVGFTYKMTLYLTFDRTILGDEGFNIKIPIEGETKTIKYGDIYDSIILTGKIAGVGEC